MQVNFEDCFGTNLEAAGPPPPLGRYTPRTRGMSYRIRIKLWFPPKQIHIYFLGFGESCSETHGPQGSCSLVSSTYSLPVLIRSKAVKCLVLEYLLSLFIGYPRDYIETAYIISGLPATGVLFF